MSTNVARPSMPPLDEYIAEISSLWETRWLTNMGDKHKELTGLLKDYLSVANVELFVNGHMALELTLQGFGLEGEVITTPFTFASTVHAIVRNGLTPVFCDIDPDTYCLDPKKLEGLITERTCGVMPVHVYGNICDVAEIEGIARKYRLKVIYDAAHAFGETANGIGVGNFGDASCFSFHATKVFNTIEGGAVCYRDAEIGDRLHSLKNFGIHGRDEVVAAGSNAKLNEFCAAMGICNLRYIDGEIEKRGAIDDLYRHELAGVDGLRLNPIQEGVKRNFAYFPVVFDERAFGASRLQVFEALAQKGINARKYFYPLANTYPCYSHKFDVTETPVALYVAERVLTLPIYGGLTEDDVKRICQIVLRIGRKI